MTEISTRAADPFSHLHEENFEQAFLKPELTADQMILTAGRPCQSLDGDWNFVLDPFQEGLRQRWFDHDDLAIGQWVVPRDYDNGEWQTAKVPGCWNLAVPEWFHYEGSAWYSRNVDVEPTGPEERLFLRVGAASGRCRVFLNGIFLGLHKGGSTPFFVEITGAVLTGANRLMLEVDNSRRADAVPMHHFDWFNYGGLFRSVEIYRVPDCFIRDFRISLAQDGGGIDVSVCLSRQEDDICRVEIEGLGSFDVPVRGGVGRLRSACLPERWSPGNPRLYRVSAACGNDRIEDRVGFRKLAVRGHEILLNDAPLELRGICVHEDDKETGRVTNEEDLRRRFAHVKELGGNAARLAHYPHHELAARIADEIGILLWQEIPVYWAIDFENPSTLADARNQLLEMIARDHNRASIILWGVGNENADTDARLSFMRELAVTAKTADPTRLTVAACLINRETFRIEDRLAEHLDVIGLNEYFGWYEPGYDNLTRLLENSEPDRPVLISETGADAVSGLHGGVGRLFTEERQADVLENQVRLTSGYSYVAGIFPWLLYDFRSQRRQTAHQRGWNRKGIVAEDKETRKLGFAALREAYAVCFTKGGDADGRS